MSDLLLIRAEDLVVLGITSTGCRVDGGVLRAVESEATMTVVFPPQAVSETKVEAAFIQGGLQSRSSSIVFDLSAGTEIPLDLPSILEMLAGRDVPATATTRIELPAGLIQRPVGPVRGAGPTQPIAADGVTGLWEYVVRSSDTQPLTLLAHDVLADDEGSDIHPLDFRDRSTIKESGLPSTVERLRLSALGGTLSSTLVSDALEWDQVTALGRDQRVRFQQRGVLYPFGHAAVLTVTAVRRVRGGTASLHREAVLRVVDPVRRLPATDVLAARAFPFSQAELLTPTMPGIDHQNPFSTFTRPPDVKDLLVQRQQAAGVELETARTTVGERYRLPIPQDELSCEGHPLDTGNAIDFRQLGIEIADLEAQQAQIIADGTIVTDDIPPTTFVPQSVADAANALQPGIDERKARQAVAHQRFVAFDLPFLQGVVPGQAELANPDLYVQRLASQGDEDARTILRLLEELERLAAILGPEAAPPVVSRVLDPPGGGLHAVRLTGPVGDIVVHVPLFFVHDLRVPADEFFGGYSSLDDPSVLVGLPSVSCGLPGTPVDLVRRPGDPRTTDVQELHSIAIGAEKSGREVSPVLDSFELELPELRTLLPGTPTRVRARLDQNFVSGGPAKDVIRLDTAVKVDFDKRAERGGALVTPSFSADVVSDEFGPIDRRMLPGGNPMAALANMKLFGISLTSILGDVLKTPSILQIPGADGIPRGVELTWPEQNLKSKGPFTAHSPEPIAAPDTTTLRLRVSQDLARRDTECVLTAFTLRLPTPETEVLRLSFGALTFREGSGQPPTFDVDDFNFSFEGSLKLIKQLQEKASAILGGAKPQVELREDGVTAIFALRVADASSGAFLMRNIVVHIRVHIPFRGASPGVRIAFASRESPFQLSIPPFGGGGYAAVALEGSKLTELDISMEFGGMISVDFTVVKAEVHALGGVRSALVGDDVQLAGFIRIGGSVSLFGLASVSIEMRIELMYDGTRNQLAGRATLVIEIDLTLYSDSVELDSGLWVLAGGSSPPPPPDLGSPVAQQGWSTYQGAYA